MSLFRNICVGAAAGLAGAAAMHGFRLFWETGVSRDPRHVLFGFDHEADVNSARLAYRLLSHEVLADGQASRIGVMMHYAFGAALGILYKFAWRPAHSPAEFGALLWLCADEIPISISRISDPFTKSAASHAAAMAAHVLFASSVAEAVRIVQPEGTT